uniref:protein unc-45 homolog B-like n=1 Tax=Myxine glutinosa TaxID=7769 RepID=UPI00358E291F
MTASVLASKLYDDLRCDSERENFSTICEEYIANLQNLPANTSGNLRAIQAISGLLQGPFDVGNRLLTLNGVMQNMITLSASEKELEQIVAVEALILAAAKASHANFITTNGVSLLKDIYKGARSEAVMIRALVGLCKLGSAGGTDYSMRQFAEGSTGKLAKQCRKWLCNTALDSRTRRWAVEGLAYLTLDADVKEDLVQDGPVLHAMLDLSQVAYCKQTVHRAVSMSCVCKVERSPPRYRSIHLHFRKGSWFMDQLISFRVLKVFFRVFFSGSSPSLRQLTIALCLSVISGHNALFSMFTLDEIIRSYREHYFLVFGSRVIKQSDHYIRRGCVSVCVSVCPQHHYPMISSDLDETCVGGRYHDLVVSCLEWAYCAHYVPVDYSTYFVVPLCVHLFWHE